MNISSLLRSALSAFTLSVLFLTFSLPALSSPTLTVLHSFDYTDGQYPYAGLTQASDGYLYGTTSYGGGAGEGVIYKIDMAGTNFSSLFALNYANTKLSGGVIQGTDGNLYGTTSNVETGIGSSVYRIETNGANFVEFYQFGRRPGDGSQPEASLIQASDGELYGTTLGGGANNDGTIFSVVPGNAETLVYLHSFGANDLNSQSAPLIEGSDGRLYGATGHGGANNDGSIFQINRDGTGYTLLHTFGSIANDGLFSASLIDGGDGFLYGTSSGGGLNAGGTVFKIKPDGSGYQIIHNFAFAPADGNAPAGPLVLANDGNLYGATLGYGAEGGAVFEISRDGSEYSILHIFTGAEGSGIFGGLIQGTDGNFYGAASEGGANSDGSVFKLSTGLPASPTGLSLLVQSPAEIDLKWNAFPGATSYNVYRGAAPDQESAMPVAAGLTSPSFVDNDLYPGTTYYFRVTAVVGGVETADSAEMSGATSIMGFGPGLQMIAAPADYTGLTVAEYLSHPDLAIWTGSSYAVTPNSPANAMVPGYGYWINVPAGTIANLWDDGTVLTGTSAVNVPLVAGWNMIGNPFDLNIPVAALQVQKGANLPVSFATANANGLVGNTLYTYHFGDTAYEVLPASSSTLIAYEGYWLYAFAPCTLIFPAGG